MSSSLNQRFTPWSLLTFAAPSIIMMMFMSLYTIVDGIFVSRFVGSNALSSINIVFPVINVAIAVATMLATGGNAIISRYLGENRPQKANACLTQFVCVTIGLSILFLAFILAFTTPLSRFLGASDILLSDCNTYLRILGLFVPACMLQALFQSYLVTAGRPNFGLALTIGAGICNAVLDYVLIAVCQFGVAGAAIATCIGQCIPAVVGLFFFFLNKNGLHFTKFSFHKRELLQACYNGSSEMVSQLSMAIVTVLFNIVLMRIAGEHGVAAITILLYGEFLFNSFYLGFSIGIAPIVGFQYGAQDKVQLKRVYRIAFAFVMISSVVLLGAAEGLSCPIITIFTDDPETFPLALTGFRLFSISFLFSGFNITSSGFFTALSNGKVSAILSFCRTFIFTTICLLALPHFLGINGAWIAVPIAEICTLLISLYMHQKYFIRSGKQNYFAS